MGIVRPDALLSSLSARLMLIAVFDDGEFLLLTCREGKFQQFPGWAYAILFMSRKSKLPGGLFDLPTLINE
jgi:hypothetical protein